MRVILFVMAITMALSLVSCDAAEVFDEMFGPSEREEEKESSVSDNAEFHFIDVGQADAILIRVPEGDILIDAGTNDSEEALRAYLDELDVDTIEYAVFTHPHADHIGGADMIMKTYDVKNVIMPDATATSKVFTRMLDAIEASDAKVIEATPDKTYSVGDLTLTVLGPQGSGYTDVNNYSVAVRVDWGNTSALFTGDAEDVSEEEMLDAYGRSGELDVDLFKVAHHGAKNSNTKEFLREVSPVYAVISVGEGNTYGHPTRQALERLEDMDVTYWRTDLEGSVVIVSDGEDLHKQ
jgi:competence protein ComEC